MEGSVERRDHFLNSETFEVEVSVRFVVWQIYENKSFLIDCS